jgi:outer membrane protein OmpA-like peptidoglycan-associated protein
MTNIMVFFVIIWVLSNGKGEGISETTGDVTSRMIDLPGDVLFAPGQTALSKQGTDILKQLFQNPDGTGILSFEDSDIVKRLIVFHGHTDSDGEKKSNLHLAFLRAYSAYEEVQSYNPELPEHVIICSHADNSAKEDVPTATGAVSSEMKTIIKEIKAKNRRITIEDKSVNKFESEEK